MPITQRQAAKPKNIPSWFTQKPSDIAMARFKKATVRYIIDNHLKNKLPKPTTNLCRSILPILRVFDRKWNDVTHENFNTTYLAHAVFSDTVRSLIQSKKELKLMLDLEDPQGGEEEEDEEAAWPEDEAHEDSPLEDMDNILVPEQINANVPPLPGSSE